MILGVDVIVFGCVALFLLMFTYYIFYTLSKKIRQLNCEIDEGSRAWWNLNEKVHEVQAQGQNTALTVQKNLNKFVKQSNLQHVVLNETVATLRKEIEKMKAQQKIVSRKIDEIDNKTLRRV